MAADIRERILAVQEKSGFVPNVFLAFFGMSNRLANAASMRPNDEFHMLGR